MTPQHLGRLLLAALSTLTACVSTPPTVVPMRTLAQPAPCGPTGTLIVMLPGRHSPPEEFLREGFVETLRRERIEADVVLVDAHMGYYRERSVIDRLHADVIAPARARGQRVWLVGISLGAAGSMLYADEHPRVVDGMVLIAPYLGERSTAKAIEAAGGLATWPAPARREDEAIDLRLWRWIKTQTLPASAGAALEIFQGYGVDDRFAYNNRLLGRSLPAQRVYTVPGGHDWPAWNALWQRIVPDLPLPRSAACGVAGRG